MHLSQLFDLSLIGRADRPALEVAGPDGAMRTLSFGEVDQRADRMAQVLVAHGVSIGDRVAVHLANRLEFIDVFLACVRLGAVVVPVNVLYRERELAHIVADAAPRLVITTADARAWFPPSSLLVEVEVLAGEAEAVPVVPLRLAIDGDAPLAIVYTSGTTGRAKGAVLTHNNFLVNTLNVVGCWAITEADRYLAVLPLFHVHGLANGLCGWLASGCRMRLFERFDHEQAVGWFDDFSPTLFFGVPTIYHRLLAIDADAARRIGARMRLFVCGSAPLPAHVFDAFAERFGHAILERYGMSETLMLISNPYVGERRPGTVGSPMPGVSVRLGDPDGGEVPDGAVGEVLVRGANVCAGYWRNGEATAQAFAGGWFHTSDLAERSTDGYYMLRGRVSELIISGGFNIYPAEIEELLLDVPAVRDVAVVGAPDERRGEVPVAYVVADDGFDDEEARALCVRSLASFKIPRAFIRVEALPRNALGKVQKHLLPVRR